MAETGSTWVIGRYTQEVCNEVGCDHEIRDHSGWIKTVRKHYLLINYIKLFRY